MAGMKKPKSKRASVMARYSILLGFMLVIATWIAYNTFKNAVVDAGKWEARAKKELSRMERVIEPERGDILAADGSVLATTLQYYTLRIDFGSEGFKWKEYVAEKDALAEAMHKHFPIAGGLKAWQDSLDCVLYRKKRPRGWRLIHNVTYADYMQIKDFPFFKGRKRNHHGLLAEPKKRRINPYGDMAQLSIGYVTEDPATGKKRGYSGLEKALDNYLYGKAGVARQVTFTRGIGKWEEVAAERGWDVKSTIDVQMQDIVESALMTRLQETHAEWGTAVLMDVHTGEIKAMSNLEEDPKNERRYIEAMNRAVRGFEPGSVVKTLSMMIAIEDGYVTDLDSVVQIGQSYRAFGTGRPITDSHFNSELTIRGIIEESSNIGMARVLSKFYRSPQGWHDRVAALGLLQPLNSGIYEERSAKYPVPKNGAMTTLSRQFYGYGCELTPLHTLSIYNAIANGGKLVRPRLVRSLHKEDRDSVVPVDYVVPHFCSEKTAAMMRECLYAVCNGEHGTARSLKNPYVKLAGKTGTCYTLAGGAYDTSRKRLAFCGYFPAENPKYTCMVLIYHPRETAFGAASTSGAVLRNVAMSMYARGMLDNESDYSDSGTSGLTGKQPLAFASSDAELSAVVNRVTGVVPNRFAPQKVTEGLPDVSGMGLREAVSILESTGVNVTFDGVGLVASQSPGAGTPSDIVHLTLKP